MIAKPLLAVVGMMLISMTTALGQTVVFLPPDNPPQDGEIDISVLTDDADTVPDTVARSAAGWEYKVSQTPGSWRREPTFLIKLPARTVEKDGVSSDPMILQLSFSFKAGETNEKIEVPLGLFPGFSLRDRMDVANLPSFQTFQKVLMAQALALHFVGRLPDPHSSMARFSTKVWFDALYFAIVNDHRPLRLGRAVADMINRVYDNDGGSLAYFEGSSTQLRRKTWADQGDLADLLAAHNCDAAKSLTDYLDGFNKQNPADALAVGIDKPDAIIAAMRTRTGAVCAPPLTP